MITFSRVTIILFLVLFFNLHALALEQSPLLNSVMKDYKNTNVTLYKPDSPTLIVLMAFGTRCPVVRKYIPELNLLANDKLYKERSVKFFLLQSELYDKQKDIEKFIINYELKVTVLKDPKQKLTKELGLTISSEVIVYDNVINKVIYKGAVNDGITIDSTNPPKNHYLKDAIAHWLDGSSDKIAAFTKASGCHISFD